MSLLGNKRSRSITNSINDEVSVYSNVPESADNSEIHYQDILVNNLNHYVSKNLIYLPKYITDKNLIADIKDEFSKFNPPFQLDIDFMFQSYSMNYLLKCIEYLNFKFPMFKLPDFTLYEQMDQDGIEIDFKESIEYILKNMNKGDILYVLCIILNYDVFLVYPPQLCVFLINRFLLPLSLFECKIKVKNSPNQIKTNFIEIGMNIYFQTIVEIANDYDGKDPFYDKNKELEAQQEKEKQIKFVNDYNAKLKQQFSYTITQFRTSTQIDNIPNDANAEKITFQIKAKFFGFVIYMDQSMYSNIPSQDKDIHFPHLLEILVKGTCSYLANIIPNKKVKRIILGHEHGDKNCKCHYQGFIELESQCKNNFCPGTITIPYYEQVGSDKKEITYLIMFQKGKNKFALENYVKKNDPYVKEHKFVQYDFVDKTVKDVYRELGGTDDNVNPTVDQLDLIISLNNLDTNILRQYALECNDKNTKRFIISNFERIIKFSQMCHDNDPTVFHWRFPVYIDNFIDKYKKEKDFQTPTNYEKYNFYIHFKEWFNRYCMNNKANSFLPTNRKKGLIIYGERGIGKTMLCKSLAMDIDTDDKENPFVVYCRGTLSWDRFAKKKDTAELIILDDVTFVAKQKEIVKALLVGQATNFKSNFIDNEYWNRSCPCIILTNNLHTFMYMLKSPEFKEDAFFMAINTYIGPDNTQPRRQEDIYLDEYTKKLIENEEINEKKKKSFNNNKYFNNLFSQ